MKRDIELVSRALEQFINGDPAPSFRSPEFANLMTAAKCIAASTPEGGYLHAEYARLGNRALHLLVMRLAASAHAEKALAQMLDAGKSLC